MNILNPAFTGSENQTILSLTSRNQWISIDNAPKTQVLIFSSPRKKNVGLGLSFISNKYFVEDTSIAYIDFSYKLNLTENSSKFVGVQNLNKTWIKKQTHHAKSEPFCIGFCF